MHTAPAPQPTARRPLTNHLSYRDAAGRHCVAYARSPWNSARWLVVRMATSANPEPTTDLECVVDDYGHLVPMRQRELTSDFSSSISWRGVQ